MSMNVSPHGEEEAIKKCFYMNRDVLQGAVTAIKAKAAYDEYAVNRHKLKEAEGERLAIESLAQHIKKPKNKSTK